MSVCVHVCARTFVLCIYVIGLTYYYNNDDGINEKCKSVDLLKFLSFSFSVFLSFSLCLFLLSYRMEWSEGFRKPLLINPSYSDN